MTQTSPSKKRISPLKDCPPHFPGQSLAERADELGEKFTEQSMYVAIIWMFALLEWYLYFVPQKPNPWMVTVIAIGVTIWAYRPLRRMLVELRNTRKGLKGEQLMGKFLEDELVPIGYHVLHDIPGPNFNVDHVVIGPSGIFSVETKFWERPHHGHHEITYDNKAVLVDGKTPDRDPIVQAKAAGSYVADLIERYTGKRRAVQPILVYLGWYVAPNRAHTDIWVLNEQAVPPFITHHRDTISPEDIALVTAQLKNHIHTKLVSHV